MDDEFVKKCVVCRTEKNIDNFYNKYRECKTCNIKRVLKRYYIIINIKNLNNVAINMHV